MFLSRLHINLFLSTFYLPKPRCCWSISKYMCYYLSFFRTRKVFPKNNQKLLLQCLSLLMMILTTSNKSLCILELNNFINLFSSILKNTIFLIIYFYSLCVFNLLNLFLSINLETVTNFEKLRNIHYILFIYYILFIIYYFT